MQYTLNNHICTISVGGYNICNMRLTDDIDLMARSIPELQQIIGKLYKFNSGKPNYNMEKQLYVTEAFSLRTKILILISDTLYYIIWL